MRLKMFFLVVVVFSMPVYTYETTMNFAYKIGQDKSETIHVNEADYSADVSNNYVFTSLARKYISSRRGTIIFGIIFAGDEFINAGFDSSYSGTEYLLHAAQGSKNNRFIIGFTNTTQGNFDSASGTAELYRIVLSTIYTSSYAFAPSRFYMVLEPDALVTSYIKWSGAVNLVIKNNGLSDGVYNISLET